MRARQAMAQTILIVDERSVQRRLLEAAITRSGMASSPRPGGQPALDLLNGPRGTNSRSCSSISSCPTWTGWRCRAAKGQSSQSSRHRADGQGRNRFRPSRRCARARAIFLVKPASPERIAVSIRNALKIGALAGEYRGSRNAPTTVSISTILSVSAARCIRWCVWAGGRHSRTFPFSSKENLASAGGNRPRHPGFFRARRAATSSP